MFKKILQKIIREQLIERGDKVVIGFSGGPDSVFLVEILKKIKEYIEFEFFLVHINHMLRGKNADEDEKFSKRYAEKNKLEIFIKRVDVGEIAKKEKKGIEVAGREIRYNFFYEIMRLKKANKIAVAHNLDDQIENFLFRLIRGTSLKGLEGILSHTNIIRPINEIYKVDIINYLDKNKIDYRIDETNLENKYTRNSIRLDLIPFIEKRYNPKFKRNIANLIQEIRETNKEQNLNLKNYLIKKENTENLDILKVNKEEIFIQQNIIYKYLKKFGIIISNEKIKNILKILSQGGTKIIDLGNNLSLIKSYNEVKVVKKEEKNRTLSSITVRIPFKIKFGKYMIEAKETDSIISTKEEFITNLKLGDTIEIRTRREGDKINPIGMKGYKKLKEIFINEKIPRDLRDKIPLIVKDNQIVWVAGVKKSNIFKSDQKEGVKLLVRRQNG